MFKKSLFILNLLTVLYTLPAAATPPCLPDHCPSIGLNAKQCWQQASWVAVGTIENAIRDPLPTYFNGELSSAIRTISFTFRVARWEKAPPGDRPETIAFLVMWCGEELPANSERLYRFYGSNAPVAALPVPVVVGNESHLSDPMSRYRHFEPVEARGKK